MGNEQPNGGWILLSRTPCADGSKIEIIERRGMVFVVQLKGRKPVVINAEHFGPFLDDLGFEDQDKVQGFTVTFAHDLVRESVSVAEFFRALNDMSLRQQATDALKKVPEGPLGKDLFEEGAKRFPGIAVEAALFRGNEEKQCNEVYLTRRKDGEAYAGQWHVPGSFLRSGETLEQVFERLSVAEFGTKIIYFGFAGQKFVTDEVRFATLLDMVYHIETEGEPTAANGAWFSVDELPSDIIDGHRDFVVPTALEECMRRAWALKCLAYEP
ncbi:MAG: NUDIX domain-containing protein [Candidatus Magasanikbacteria bacterium]